MIIYKQHNHYAVVEDPGKRERINSFRDLLAWQKSHELVLTVYQLTQKFPSSERFGLISQLRRSAASVPANIAEGMGRESKKELVRFLNIANGSLEESRYFLILAKDLNYITEKEFNAIFAKTDSISRIMNGFIRRTKELYGV